MPNASVPLAQTATDAIAEIVRVCATGLAGLDPDLCFRWINPAFAEWLGVARGWIGQPLSVLDDGSGGVVAAAERARDTQRRVVLRQARLQGIDGSGRIGEISFTPLAGECLLLELHEAAGGVDSAPGALSESLRGFAHEVKNPLAGVRGAAQLLARRVESAELVELAELVIAESDRLANLADRLLRAGGKPRMAALNVHELLERVAALVAAEAGAPEVRRDYDPSLPAASGDGDRLFQLLLNLARNAVEAGARTLVLRTRVEFGIRLGERLRRAVLRIDVIDDGHGVAPALADTLYEPLVSGRPDGSGLGLALAREIAAEHDGELRHASRPGDTRFILLLPLERAA